ncbi:MAG: hypothetical protein DDT21_01835 [Syntrophomonadaceae bacterium]|nr:hypothetical protein [Bacillota bacterium]
MAENVRVAAFGVLTEGSVTSGVNVAAFGVLTEGSVTSGVNVAAFGVLLELAIPPVSPAGGGQSVPGTRAANSSQSQGTVAGTRAANTGSSSRSGSGGEQSRTLATPRFNPTSILDAMDGTAGYVQWRAYIGPPFRASTASDFYDWSALILAVYTPSPSDTTLSSGVASGATVANLTNAASFPTRGGLWLGPNAPGESWGYATYTSKATNQLTGLVRDTVDAEYTGVHTSGAIARFWWPLDTATAEPVLRETMDNTYSAVGWEGTVGGIVAPVPAMRANHLFLMQNRELSVGTWGNWTNWLIGWTLGSTVQDNADRERPWTLQVAGLNGILSQVEVTGLRVGPPDIADNANITVSSTLSPAYKEANTGEFVGSNPNIGSGAMVDNDTATAWISGGFVGENNVYPTNHQVITATLDAMAGSEGVTQFHISKYPGQSNGYRWIEISHFLNIAGGNLWLFGGYNYFVNLAAAITQTGGDRIIFAENPTLFAEENPDSKATAVYDLRNYQLWRTGYVRFTISTGGATAGTFTLTCEAQTTSAIAHNATADTVLAALVALAIVEVGDVTVTGAAGGIWTATFVRRFHTGAGANLSGSGAGLTGGSFAVTQTENFTNPYYYGVDGTFIFDYIPPAGGLIRLSGALEDSKSYVIWGTYTADATFTTTVWTGAALTAPRAGQTMRMKFFPTSPTASRDYWEVSKIATPGYNVITSMREWVYFSLPTMGLSLVANINNSVTSIVIGKKGQANVDGLPASSTIQIGIEQITYTAINRTTGTVSGGARGANSTTAVAHLAGDTVYFVTGGVATEGYPIDTVQIVRPAGFSVPKDFLIWTSELATARKPGDDYFTDDYTLRVNVTGNTVETYSLDLSATAPRIRYLLVEVTAMSASPSRMKINELRVLINGNVLDSSKYLASGSVATAMSILTQAAGIPAGAITDNGGTQTVTEYTTQTDLLWPVLVDLAEFTNTRVTVGRDSKITFQADPFWSISGTPLEDSELTRTSAAHVEINKMPVPTVGQIELTWRPPTSEARDIAIFPTTYTTGRKVKVGPYIYADVTAALAGATKRYYQMRRPYDAVVELATQGDTIRAGTVRGLNWILHDSQLAQDRTYMCIQSAHTIKNFGWNSVLTLLQLTRTDEL